MPLCTRCNTVHPDGPCPAGQSLVGETLDKRYRIDRKLGEGGMGVVYAAQHVLIDKRVAVKVLKPGNDATAAQRFIQEAKSASKIGHANIVDITDFGELPDGGAYFVMEYIDGKTLASLLKEGPVEPRRACRLARQIADGLRAAHACAIVHRDLKPDNIFVVQRADDELVKIVDFGIARIIGPGSVSASRLTQLGMVLGTPEYMAPEQAMGKETDHRVDEYALGCILYEMLTGTRPFTADNATGMMTKHAFDPIDPPRQRRPDLAIPAALETIVLRAMAKKADGRYPDMAQMIAALDEVERKLAVESPRSPSEIGLAATALSTAIPEQPVADSGGGGRGRVALVGAAVVFAVAGALAVVIAVRHGSAAPAVAAAPAPAAATATTTTTTTTVAAPAAAPAPAPAPLRATVDTVPPGASLTLDGKLLGTAPQVITLAAGERKVVTAHLAGYVDRDAPVSSLEPPAGPIVIRLAAAPHVARPAREKHGESRAGRIPDLRNPF